MCVCVCVCAGGQKQRQICVYVDLFVSICLVCRNSQSKKYPYSQESIISVH